MASTTSAIFAAGPVEVSSPSVSYTPAAITATYSYETTSVQVEAGRVTATPVSNAFVFTTQRAVPRLGCMIVGLGGNNGTTVAGAILANKLGLKWHSKLGEHSPDYIGSLTQSSSVRLGSAAGRDVYVPFSSLLPMVDPNTIVVGGWDISSLSVGAAMERAQVLDYDLQRQLRPLLDGLVPLPSIYYPDFIAANQCDRADNLLPGQDKGAHLEAIRGQIRAFKAAQGVDKVVVLWSANTERFSSLVAGVNDTEANLLAAIARSEQEVSPSTVFAVAAILEVGAAAGRTQGKGPGRWDSGAALRRLLLLLLLLQLRYHGCASSSHGCLPACLPVCLNVCLCVSPPHLRLQGCTFINGSPQNTCVPGVLALAQRCGVFVGGDDFKSGGWRCSGVGRECSSPPVGLRGYYLQRARPPLILVCCRCRPDQDEERAGRLPHRGGHQAH